jgi:hypothetical protein
MDSPVMEKGDDPGNFLGALFGFGHGTSVEELLEMFKGTYP